MRHSIGIVAIALLVIVGCGDDKKSSTGPEQTLDELLTGEWQSGQISILLNADGSYEQVSPNGENLYLIKGRWETTAGDFLILQASTIALLNEPNDRDSFRDSITAKVSLSGNTLLLDFTPGTDNSYSLTFTRVR
jgi:hypothetical protein